MQCDDALKIVSQFSTLFRQPARKCIAFDIVRMREVIYTTQQGAEHLSITDDTPNRYTTEIYAVIATLTTNKSRSTAITLDPVIGNCHFQRSFH